MKKFIMMAAFAATLGSPAFSQELSKENKHLLWHCQNNDYDRVAIDACTDFIASTEAISKENLAIAYFARGESFLNLRLNSMAREDFSHAIEHGLRTRRVFVHRADLYRENSQYQRAVDDYDLAITFEKKDNFDDAHILAHRAAALAELGKVDDAIASVDKAIALNPKDDWSYFVRGFSHALNKDWENAIADYTKAIELDPKGFRSYYHRSTAYRNVGEFAKADADYQKARQLNPRLPDPKAKADDE